ncbi:hypothetical protein B1690_01155 [Geobacillus sp. 46C-IIa]|uniref:hypothetical protein n=1 Tax=Geobacillus sp. 46C-IIa TaxID=1963025 RepID=UPI0009BF5DDE|nr:hypothetical protein [Geobacillus sp. 46C-IIa]OQP07926.1 hypothetical protein B1690_01155 [Geobacillus sp. 46C-IIa]QNU26912.1 hypothetical protein IC803_11380 [Geobacillus sp. 46C-IIa]
MPDIFSFRFKAFTKVSTDLVTVAGPIVLCALLNICFFYRASLGGPGECNEQMFATLVRGIIPERHPQIFYSPVFDTPRFFKWDEERCEYNYTGNGKKEIIKKCRIKWPLTDSFPPSHRVG